MAVESVRRARQKNRAAALARLPIVPWFTACFLLLTWKMPSLAQERDLLDREPFDQIVLNQESGGQVLDVFPLDLPQRPLASLPKQGAIKVRLLNRRSEQFELSWSDVAEVRVHEQMLLQEASRLTESGKYDEAFDYLVRLNTKYPAMAGLNEASNKFLLANALSLDQDKEHDRALAVLLSLAERDSKSPGLNDAVESVAGKMIEQHLRQQDHAAARAVLDLWNTQFNQVGTAGAEAWQRRFEAAAQRQLAEAQRLIQSREYIAARRAGRRALRIWPKLAAANEVLVQIQREFPCVTIGVFETSPRQPTYRLDNWAALRSSRLVDRQLVEQVGFHTEGGVYRSPYGDLIPDESGTRLSLKLKSIDPAHGLTADNLVRYLLQMADPRNALVRRDLAAFLAGVSIPTSDVVQIDWRHPHVRPEALLQVSLPTTGVPVASNGSDATSMPTRFIRSAPEGENVAFAVDKQASPDWRGSFNAVVEQTFPDDEAAIAALLAGELDVLDRVPPWHLERLRAAADIRVESYRLPTVHVLVPNPDRPLSARRDFRRAICFGIHRDWIVRRLLLGGAEVPGFEVVSGPFPSGASLGDPIRYGYNNQLSPRPYEPRLAAILATVAWSNLLDPEGKGTKDLTAIPEQVLAHPSDPVVRLACQTIQQQLGKAGIPVKLVECSADELAVGGYDLRYAELTVGEPVVDARRILGPGGLATDIDSPYLDAALRRLDNASNWPDVRARLAEIHEIATHDLPVIPLWQTGNYFAYRTSLRGIGDAPIALYQDLDQWTTAPSDNVARASTRD